MIEDLIVFILGGEDRLLLVGEGAPQHWGPRRPDLPPRCRPHRRLLRVPLRGRGARHYPAATPPEPADNPPHRQDDCRRVKVRCHSQLSPGTIIMFSLFFLTEENKLQSFPTGDALQ